MDDWIREVLATSDRHEVEYEAWQAQQEQRLETCRRDYEEPWLREDCPAGVDRKAWWLERQAKRARKSYKAELQRRNAIDDASRDRQIDARIKKAFRRGGFMQRGLVEFVCEFVRRRLEEEKQKLRAEFDEKLAALRTDVNVQTAIAKGEIAELKRDVA